MGAGSFRYHDDENLQMSVTDLDKELVHLLRIHLWTDPLVRVAFHWAIRTGKFPAASGIDRDDKFPVPLCATGATPVPFESGIAILHRHRSVGGTRTGVAPRLIIQHPASTPSAPEWHLTLLAAAPPRLADTPRCPEFCVLPALPLHPTAHRICVILRSSISFH